MRILLRADANALQGTGHVMRCLTLGEALARRGHTVELMTRTSGVDWLDTVVADAGLTLHACEPDALDVQRIAPAGFDWVVVDSYRIDPLAVSVLSQRVPTLAVVDGDTRGIEATLFLDQNLGAESLDWPTAAKGRVLAGSTFALVRSAVLAHRRTDAWRIRGELPHVVAFMGGSDPLAITLGVSRVLAGLGDHLTFTVVAPTGLVSDVSAILRDSPFAVVMGPTTDLPSVLAAADIVVSAAGTSAWDVCSMGIPSVLVGVVDNQKRSVEQAALQGVAWTLDTTPGSGRTLDDLGPLVAELLVNEPARRTIAEACAAAFDGVGPDRVAQAMEEWNIR